MPESIDSTPKSNKKDRREELQAPERESGERIAVIGPGAMGCLLAAFLWKAGLNVTLVDHSRDRAGRLGASGITIIGEDGPWYARPRVTADPRRLPPQDLIVIMVKGFHNHSILEALTLLSHDETHILTLQNGLSGPGDFQGVVPAQRILIGVTSMGANVESPGRVHHAGTGPTIVGPALFSTPSMTKARETARLLSDSGWPSEAVEEIAPYQWKKLMVNVGINAVTALTCLKNGEILEYPQAVKLQEALVTEAYQVAQAQGVEMGMDLKETMEFVKGVCVATGPNSSSMLQDRLSGRKTEIERINGAIVRLGQKYGVPVPVNDALVELVTLNTRLGWRP